MPAGDINLGTVQQPEGAPKHVGVQNPVSGTFLKFTGDPASPVDASNISIPDVSGLPPALARKQLAEFGVVADGVTDDGNAMLEALTWAMNTGGALFHSGGDVYLPTWTQFPVNSRLLLAFDGRAAGSSFIRGTGKTDTKNLFEIVDGGSITLIDVSLDAWRQCITVKSGINTPTQVILSGGTYSNSLVVINTPGTAVPGDMPNGSIRIVLSKSPAGLLKFRGNTLDVQIVRIAVDGVWIDGVDAQDGGPESVNISSYEQGFSSKDFFISSSQWRNYTNNRTGGDADGHFLRLYGERAKVVNCDFTGLYCSGPNSGDTEGIRGNIKDLQISNCNFTDAGLREGVIVNKGTGGGVIVSNCRFVITDAYKTAYPSHSGGMTPFTYQTPNIRYHGCYFEGFTIPGEFTSGIDHGIISFSDCQWLNCGQIIRFIALSYGKVYFDNCRVDGTVDVIFAQSAGDDLEVEMVDCQFTASRSLVYASSLGHTFSLTVQGGFHEAPIVIQGGTSPGSICKHLRLNTQFGDSYSAVISSSTTVDVQDWDIDLKFGSVVLGSIRTVFQMSLPESKVTSVVMDSVGIGEEVTGSYKRTRTEADLLNIGGTVSAVSGSPDQIEVKSDDSSDWTADVIEPVNTSQFRARIGNKSGVTGRYKGRVQTRSARRLGETPAVLSGTPRPGNTLTSTEAGQWKINGVDAPGEIGTTFSVPYTVHPGDLITQGDLSNTLTVVPFDAGTSSYLNAGIALGGSMDIENQWHVDSFIAGCKADPSPIVGVSNWTAMRTSCLLCAWDNLEGVFTPLRGAAPTVWNFESSDYSRTEGLKGNGVDKWINTGRSNASDTLNDCHLACWRTEAEAAGATEAVMGNNASGRRTLMVDAANRIARVSSTAIAGRSDASRTPGFWGASRHESTQFIERYDGTDYTITDTSSAPNGSFLHVFARNNAGMDSPSSARLSFYSYGASVDLGLLEARLDTLMTVIT